MSVPLTSFPLHLSIECERGRGRGGEGSGRDTQYIFVFGFGGEAGRAVGGGGEKCISLERETGK